MLDKVWLHLSWSKVLEGYSEGTGPSDGHHPQSSKATQGSISCQDTRPVHSVCLSVSIIHLTKLLEFKDGDFTLIITLS